MKFTFSKTLNLAGFNNQKIQYFKRNTGYGQLYLNYQLATQYLNSDAYQNLSIPINQCDYNLSDPTEQNCFVIFQSEYLPQSFIQGIKKQTGVILVNSQWMRQVVLSQSNCNPNRIIKLPYLQNFDKLNKYKKLKMQKNPNIITYYTIADYKDVKNLLSLYDAFNLAFQGQQDVELIIKTSNAQFLQKGLYNRKYKYHKITLINQMISEVDLYKLHMCGDIYISTAYCVGWQIPPFQASYFGKPLICGNHSAFTEWVDFNKAITLQSYKKEVILKEYSQGRFKNKHGRGRMVNMIDVDEIVSKLKYAYDNYDKIKNNYTDVSMYDIKNIDFWLQKNTQKQN